MLQTLFYIPCELFGQPVFGYGLLLAMWAAAGGAWLAWLVRRQGFNADTRGHVQVLAVLGAIIAWVLPLLCESRGLPIRGYGMMMLLAVLAGLGLAVYRARRVGVDPELIFTLAFWLILPGILGARAVYVCEYWFRDFWPEYKNGLGALIFAIVNVPKGGLVVYGGFFGGVLGLVLFCRRYRVPLLATADLIAPSMLVGLALGRVGCLLNGCCYGGHCDLFWKVSFPWNSPVHQHEAEQGMTDIFGLKFRDGPNDLPVVDNVEDDLPGARQGLAAGMEIEEINGSRVAAIKGPNREIKVTSKEQAARAVLGIDKLDLWFRGKDSEVSLGSIDDPPESQVHGNGMLKIYGIEITGGDDQPAVVSHVRWQSAEYSAGVRKGQRVASLSGRRVETIGQLRQLLDEHRQRPWLDIRPSDYAQPIRLAIDRPLPRSLPVHPTQFYSTIDALILCFLLLVYDRFRRRDGALTALMITIYPITRFLIERLRTDEGKIWGTGLHISQNISLALLVTAIGLWICILRQPAKLAFSP